MRGATEPLEAASKRKQGAGEEVQGWGEEGCAAEAATIMSSKTRGSFKTLKIRTLKVNFQVGRLLTSEVFRQDFKVYLQNILPVI